MDILEALQNRIDFCGIIIAVRCNPNGDPLTGNAPRQDFSGRGIISDVCLKRKIRDYFFASGNDIFVTHPGQSLDGQISLKDRVKATPELKKEQDSKNSDEFIRIACKKWIDVRAFGQVFAFKEKGGGASVSVRGPVSIQEAVTLEPIIISSEGITKCINSNDAKNESGFASDRMGTRSKIDRGVYVFYGSMYPQLARLTGFSDEDAKLVRDAIIHMFQNDASASRPSGSISMDKLYWWEHNCPNGQYSPVKVFRSLKLEPCSAYPYYSAEIEELPNLKARVFQGW